MNGNKFRKSDIVDQNLKESLAIEQEKIDKKNEGYDRNKFALACIKYIYHRVSDNDFGKYRGSGTVTYERKRILGFFQRYFVKEDLTDFKFKEYVKWATIEWYQWPGGHRMNYVGYICNKDRLAQWKKQVKINSSKIAGHKEVWNV